MELNKETVKKLRGLILFTIVVLVAGFNYRGILALVGRGFQMAFPFLLGAAIAFVLNVPMRRIEKLLSGHMRGRFARPVSLVLTLIFVLGILAVVIFVVAPQLVDTIMGLQQSIPDFLAGVQREAESLFARYPEIVSQIGSIHVDWEAVFKDGLNFLKAGAGSVLTSTVSAAVSIVSGFTTFGIALIFSFYILLQKETLSRQITKLLLAYLPPKAAASILSVASLTERTFSNFLTGQCVEAVILGIMFFVTLTIMRMPYALLIGVLIAFTALIPIFGAFIGCAVGIFLMLMVSPVSAITFTVTFLILQQIEGNLIYPHVVGNSVGLPSIWVLVAVTIGGSAMGIVGMLIFIPLCSVLYSLLRDAVHTRLTNRAQLLRQAAEDSETEADGEE